MPLTVLYKSVYIINYDDEVIELRTIPDGFNTYITGLIRDISENINVRLYQKRSEHTEVVSICEASVNLMTKNPVNTAAIGTNCEAIAKRLLIKEIEAQAMINRLNQRIKKGCFLMSVAYDNSADEYMYLLAKVEHISFFDDVSFDEHTGFSKDQRKLWKSCIFRYQKDENDAIQLMDIKIYLERKADYWNNHFLELEPLVGDAENTVKAFNNIDSVLKRGIKNKAPNDYTVLRNAVIGHMKSTEHFDFENMVETVFSTYQPIDLQQEELSSLITKLSTLPEERGFDRQFTVIPKEIKAKIRKTYSVNTNIELKVNDFVENLRDIIHSEEDGNGARYIKIKTNDESTYNAFK